MIKAQIIYDMFERDDFLKVISKEHRIKLIQGMTIKEFQQGNKVFQKLD